MKDAISKEDVRKLIMNSSPKDYTHDDIAGHYFYNLDINLRLQIVRDADGTYTADWVSKFPDKKATSVPVYIYYHATLVYKISCVYADGGRYLIPEPHLQSKPMKISSFEYKIGLIINQRSESNDLDKGLQIAGIEIQDN